MEDEMKSMKCAACEKDYIELIDSKVKYHLFDGDLHIVMSKSGEGMVEDHVVSVCQVCSIGLLNGLLQMEVMEAVEVLGGLQR